MCDRNAQADISYKMTYMQGHFMKYYVKSYLELNENNITVCFVNRDVCDCDVLKYSGTDSELIRQFFPLVPCVARIACSLFKNQIPAFYCKKFARQFINLTLFVGVQISFPNSLSFYLSSFSLAFSLRPTHSLSTHSLTHSRTHALTHSLTPHSLTHCLLSLPFSLYLLSSCAIEVLCTVRYNVSLLAPFDATWSLCLCIIWCHLAVLTCTEMVMPMTHLYTMRAVLDYI